MRHLLGVVALMLLASCSSLPGSEDCATSEPIGESGSSRVPVEVVTKPGLGVNMVALLDVDGEIYSTPTGELGPETDLPVGRYDGVVTRSGNDLTLTVEGRTMPLTASSCD